MAIINLSWDEAVVTLYTLEPFPNKLSDPPCLFTLLSIGSTAVKTKMAPESKWPLGGEKKNHIMLAPPAIHWLIHAMNTIVASIITPRKI